MANNHVSFKQEVTGPKYHSISVSIADSFREEDKITFAILAKTIEREITNTVCFSVIRRHEEFVCLRRYLEDIEDYEGCIIPPAPTTPRFQDARDKLKKLEEKEHPITKQEVETERLVKLKKAITTHKVFLRRLANHGVLQNDAMFKKFLECNEVLPGLRKYKRSKLAKKLSNFVRPTNHYTLPATRMDKCFDDYANFLNEYHTGIADAAIKLDRVTKNRRHVAECYSKISSDIVVLSKTTGLENVKIFNNVSEIFQDVGNIEAQIATEEDFKLADTFRYYQEDTVATKDLLSRRKKRLDEYVLKKTKAEDLEKFGSLGLTEAKYVANQALQKLCAITKEARQELQHYKTRMSSEILKNLYKLAELEIKHSNSQIRLLKECLSSLVED